MSASLHIEHIHLPSGKDHLQVDVDWNGLSDCQGWKTLSWVHDKPIWVTPTLYPHLHNHPTFTSSLILLKSPNWKTTLAIYPISTNKANHSLIVEKGSIKSNIRRIGSATGSSEEVFVVCMRADDKVQERQLVEKVVEEARKVMGGQSWEVKSGFWDGLGICTWESFMNRGGDKTYQPTKEDLLNLIPNPKDISIKSFLIDDGWQDTSFSSIPRHKAGNPVGRLSSMGPWHGLGDMRKVVSAIKAKGVENVGVWMTLQGYWFGIDPKSPLCEKYECVRHPIHERSDVNIEEVDEYQWIPHPERAGRFWLDWFEEMKSWGIDFVKVDNQASLVTTSSPVDLEAQKAMWVGMLSAVEKVWGTTERVINCMAHNERMLNGPAGLGFDRSEGQLIYRNSDDFNLKYPQRHPDFVRWNIYNSIITSHLSIIPDVDMFATNPPDRWPTYHALLRALSPGPVLLSDTPDDDTDMALVRKLVGKSKDGKTRVVKADSAIRVLSNRWFWDNLDTSTSGPSVMAGVPVSQAGGAMIGAWNCHDPESGVDAIDAISLDDVEDAMEQELEGEVVLWRTGLSKGDGKRFDVVSADWKGKMEIELAKGECESFVLARIWEMGDKKVAVLGSLEHLSPLSGVEVYLEQNHLIIQTPYETTLALLMHIPKTSFPMISVDGQVEEAKCKSMEDGWMEVSVPVKGVMAGVSGVKWEVRVGFLGYDWVREELVS